MIERIRQRDREDEGFTLIELLIVIVVLGILAAIVVFALSNQTSNAAKTACNADAKSVEVAVEAYRAQNAVYPTQFVQLTTPNPETYLRKAPPIGTGGVDANGVPQGPLPAGVKYAFGLGEGANLGKLFVITNGNATWRDYDAAPNPCDDVQ